MEGKTVGISLWFAGRFERNIPRVDGLNIQPERRDIRCPGVRDDNRGTDQSADVRTWTGCYRLFVDTAPILYLFIPRQPTHRLDKNRLVNDRRSLTGLKVTALRQRGLVL